MIKLNININKIIKETEKKTEKQKEQLKKKLERLTNEAKRKLPTEVEKAVKENYNLNKNEIKYKLIKGIKRQNYKISGEELENLIITYRTTRKALKAEKTKGRNAIIKVKRNAPKSFDLDNTKPYKAFIFKTNQNIIKGGEIQKKGIKLIAHSEKNTKGKWVMHVFRTLSLSQMVGEEKTESKWRAAFNTWLEKRFKHYFRK